MTTISKDTITRDLKQYYSQVEECVKRTCQTPYKLFGTDTKRKLLFSERICPHCSKRKGRFIK